MEDEKYWKMDPEKIEISKSGHNLRIEVKHT
jgi:hypothetical protein